MKKITKLLIILLLIAIIFLYAKFNSQKNNDIAESLQPQAQYNFYPIQVKKNIDIPLNSLECYNFKTKEEIYNIRKQYVNSSIFANKNYTPREEVFGQIISGKPWRNLENEACLPSHNATKEERINGVSEESRFINNPHILIGIEKGFVYNTNIYSFCKNSQRYFLPYKTIYEKQTNTLISYYNINLDYMPEQFNGKNARDLGYQYAYASDYSGLNFITQNNISIFPYQFMDFIHAGGSCGVEGGCNNGSPRQQSLEFKINALPAHVTFKLWNKKPNNKNSQPDIYYKIIFEKM